MVSCKIYVDFKKLNGATKKNSYLLPLTNEVLNIIGGHEVYSFLDEFFLDTIKFLLHLIINIRYFLLLIEVFLFGLWCPFDVKKNHQHINEQSIRHSKCILMILWKLFWITSLVLVIWLITYRTYSIILEPTKIMISVWTLRNVFSWFLLVRYLVSLFQRKESFLIQRKFKPLLICMYQTIHIISKFLMGWRNFIILSF